MQVIKGVIGLERNVKKPLVICVINTLFLHIESSEKFKQEVKTEENFIVSIYKSMNQITEHWAIELVVFYTDLENLL